MKIWTLGITDTYNSPVYDCYDGYIIAANNEEDARKLANDRPGDEGPIWTDPSKVNCEHIGYTLDDDQAAGPHVIMASFHAG